ncbi:MAG: acylphosphatase [Candidatus Omnitrophica bacterium]|nr:acylphosphatase [Candidatus Omnitrophota bacterium]
MKKRLHLFYSGRVQGVGFRYTVQDIAEQQKVSGWVRNLDDSRVEVIVEAEEGVLNNFLQQISQHFSRYIQDVSMEWQPASGEFRDFKIVF